MRKSAASGWRIQVSLPLTPICFLWYVSQGIKWKCVAPTLTLQRIPPPPRQSTGVSCQQQRWETYSPQLISSAKGVMFMFNFSSFQTLPVLSTVCATAVGKLETSCCKLMLVLTIFVVSSRASFCWHLSKKFIYTSPYLLMIFSHFVDIRNVLVFLHVWADRV